MTAIKESSAQVLAEQFTIIDIENLEAIAPWDLILWSRIGESDRELKCPNLYRLVDRYYEIGHFVATTIASEPEVEDRVNAIVKFLDIAKAANDLGNFNLLMAVYSGVTHPVLKRLKTTWLKVPAERLKQLNSFIKYCDPEDNYDAMRTYIELTASSRPCLPFLGGYIAEMIQIHSMSSDYLPAISSHGERLINYAKHRKLYNVVSAVKRCDYKIPVKRKEAVLNMIRRLHALPTDGLKMKVSDWQEASSFDPLEESSPGQEFGFDAVATPRYPVLGATLGEDRTEDFTSSNSEDYAEVEDNNDDEEDNEYGEDRYGNNNHELGLGLGGDLEENEKTTPGRSKHSGLHHHPHHHHHHHHHHNRQGNERETESSSSSSSSSDNSSTDADNGDHHQQQQHQQQQQQKKRGSARRDVHSALQSPTVHASPHHHHHHTQSPQHPQLQHLQHEGKEGGAVTGGAKDASSNRGSSTPNTSRNASASNKKKVGKSRSAGNVGISKRVGDDGGTASSSGGATPVEHSTVFTAGTGQSGTVSGSGHFRVKPTTSDPALDRKMGPRSPSGIVEERTNGGGSNNNSSQPSGDSHPQQQQQQQKTHTQGQQQEHQETTTSTPGTMPTLPTSPHSSATPTPSVSAAAVAAAASAGISRTGSGQAVLTTKKNSQPTMKTSAEIDWDEEVALQHQAAATSAAPGTSHGSHSHLYQSGGGHVSAGTSPKDSHFHIISPAATSAAAAAVASASASASFRRVASSEFSSSVFHQQQPQNASTTTTTTTTTMAIYTGDVGALLAGESDDSPPSPTTSSSPPRAHPMTRQNSRNTNTSPIRRNTPTGYLTNPGSARSAGKNSSNILSGGAAANAPGGAGNVPSGGGNTTPGGGSGGGVPTTITHHLSSGSLGSFPGSPVGSSSVLNSSAALIIPSAASSVSGMSVGSGDSGGGGASGAVVGSASGISFQNSSASSYAELKLDTKRYEIALELLETEEHFVHYLKILVEDGVYPLRQKMMHKLASSVSSPASTPQSPNQPDPTTPLNEAHIRIIFSNIEALYSFHSLFLEDLHNAVRYWRSGGLGSLFSQYHHGFEAYVEYTNSRHRGDMLLELMLTMNSNSSSGSSDSDGVEARSACRLLQRQQEVILSKTGSANFMALLHLPVHRLPRILILLKEFKACTHEGHPDLAILVDAIAKLEHIAKKLPMTKEDAEQSMMQLQILNKISGWKEKRRKLRPGRNFLGEFELKLLIQGTNRFPKLTALVWSDAIFFCRTKESKMTRRKKWAVLGILKMSHLTINALTSKQARQKLRELSKEMAKSVAATTGAAAVEAKTQISWTKHPSVLEVKYIGLEWLLSFSSTDAGESFLKLVQRSKETLDGLHATSLTREPSPGACESAAIATVGSKVYMFGGAFKGQWRNELWAWDMNNRDWTKIQTTGDPPLARTEHTMCAVGKRLYLHGGQRFGSYIDDMVMFDTETGTWSPVEVKVASHSSPSPADGILVNKTPSPRSGHSLVAIGTKLYLFGGQWFESLHQRHLFNDLYCFDTETFIWSELVAHANTFVPSPRQRHVAQVIDKKLVVFGGTGISSELSDVAVYDPHTCKWQNCTDVYGYTPTSRALAGSAVFGKKLIVFGGCSETHPGTNSSSSSSSSSSLPTIDTYNDMFVFDMEAMKWSHCWLPLELLPRRGHSIVATGSNDNTLAIFCGRIVRPDSGESDPTSEVVLLHGLSGIINNVFGRAAKIEKLREKVERLSTFAIHLQALLTVVGSHYVTPPSSEGVKWDPLTTKSTFSLLENLGSLVYKAMHEPTQSLVAIKVLSHHDCSLEMLDIMAEEMQALSRCRHPGLTAYHGFAPVSNELWIVSELTMGTSLDRLKADSTTLSEKQVGSILVTVLESLAYLHSQNIVFKGIKASNIILNSDGRIKLTDWGLSPIWKPFNSLVPKNPSIMAPELVSAGDMEANPATYTAATDIYELGLMVVGLLEPYGPGRQLRTRHKFSAEVLDFVALCTASFPHRRPTAAQLLSHPFILPHLSNALRDDVLRTLYSDALAKRPARASSLLQQSSPNLGATPHETRAPLDHRISSGGTPAAAASSSTSSANITPTGRRQSSVKVEEVSLLRSTIEAIKQDHSLEKDKLNQQILALQQQNASLESRLRAIELLVSNLVIPSRP